MCRFGQGMTCSRCRSSRTTSPAAPRPRDLGVVAELNGEPLGAAWLRLLSFLDRGYGYVADDVPELTIGVRAELRGQGVGSRLLEVLIEQAVVAGFRAVSLSVEDENPARRLYQRFGFEQVDHGGGASTMLLVLRGT